MFIARMISRIFALSALAVVAGCGDSGIKDGVSGGVDRPDLGYALIEASNQLETGLAPKLLYQRCEKRAPIVEPINQKWFCRFGFHTAEGAQDCSAIMSVHPNDHWGVWKPDLGPLDPISGKTEPNLVCSVLDIRNE